MSTAVVISLVAVAGVLVGFFAGMIFAEEFSKRATGKRDLDPHDAEILNREDSRD